MNSLNVHRAVFPWGNDPAPYDELLLLFEKERREERAFVWVR